MEGSVRLRIALLELGLTACGVGEEMELSFVARRQHEFSVRQSFEWTPNTDISTALLANHDDKRLCRLRHACHTLFSQHQELRRDMNQWTRCS